MTAPFFTVLVPVYNHGRYLPQALDSLLSQSDPDWEAVVVNDGSTDNTPEVMESYARRDPRFRPIHKPNGGTSSALNAGLRAARGRWICWLSSDDLFDPRKLEVHRRWIAREGNCRFFFTHFKELDERTGDAVEVPLWREIPDPRWQVLEMLRCTYVHGNSICVERGTLSRAGFFDEGMRYGQDYDLWLRLLALGRAAYIPERTCITRRHPAQQTHGFPEACFFDSAKAAILFLNAHPFPELVPGVDLSEPGAAEEAVNAALDVAENPQAFLYGLGAHPLLLMRVLEWAWGEPPNMAERLQALICRRADEATRRLQGALLGLFWKAASVATQLTVRRFDYEPLSPASVGETNYPQLLAADPQKANALRLYLERFEGLALPADVDSPPGETREVVLVCQPGTHFRKGQTVYGTLRATLEAARSFQRAGRRVLLLAESEQGMGFIEGIPFLGTPDRESCLRAVKLLDPRDALLCVSRGDALRFTRPKRALIYHHGPHPVDGLPARAINWSGVRLVCPSEYSRRQQVGYGVSENLVHVVPNGCDGSVFRAPRDAPKPHPGAGAPHQPHPGAGVPYQPHPGAGVPHRPRRAHGLVFAGHIVDYKGVDIALRAFERLRGRFPDATLDVFGANCSWHQAREHLFDLAWLDAEGFPNWPAIERALPGVRYGGEVPAQELASAFRQASLLLMPSRIAETFGIALVEAQACGCIPVVPRRGGFPETLREGVTGYLYDDLAPAGLADAIARLWQSNLPTEAQRREAQEWAKKIFSWEATGAKLLELIESSPAQSGAGQPLRSAYLHAAEIIERLLSPIARPTARRLARLRETPLKDWPELAKGWWRRRRGKPGPLEEGRDRERT